MEFWGMEVKPGEVKKCDPGDDKYLHLSQAALGEIHNAKGNERVPLYVQVDGKKVVIGTLVYGKCDQLSLDLMFDGKFELSHSCRTGSVFFCGYSSVPEDRDDGMGGDDTDSDSEDERQAQALMHRVKENGQKEANPVKSEVRKVGVKPAKPEHVTTGKAAAKAKPEESKPVFGKKPGEREESVGDEAMDESSDDEGDSEDESDEDEDQKISKVEAASKKRPLQDSATKTPVTDKKAKTTVPDGAKKPGTDRGKKDGPKAPRDVTVPGSKDQKGQTPKAKGTPGPRETPKTPTTPGSGKKIGQHVCSSCSRNFATESALSQHNAAKHGGVQG